MNQIDPHDRQTQDSSNKVNEAHLGAGREFENPPHRLARAEHGGAWAEVWSTGPDWEFWMYRVSSLEPGAVLVVYHAGGPDDTFQSDDPLLAAHHGQPRWPDEEGWRRYLHRWLEAQGEAA